VLTWSDDFKIPDTPAPHWQVVDSSGNTYLLKRLVIKGDKQNRTIEVPRYIKDIAKVQIWCAYAEVVLGEGNFASPVAMKQCAWDAVISSPGPPALFPSLATS
jgi:hypothetical protein